MRNVSVREAIETGLLDVDSGNLVHPSSGRHYPLAKAIQMRMVNGEAGRKLLEALNIPVDEAAMASPSSQRSSHRFSGSLGDLGPSSGGGGNGKAIFK